jgi:hypothetical protein
MTTPADLDRGWLIDQFRAELLTRAEQPSFVIEEWGVGGGILWPPYGDILAPSADPGFLVIGYTRQVNAGRILGELRAYSEPIAAGVPTWWWSGEDPARVASVEAEADEREAAIFETVVDLVTFTLRYLGGIPLADIDVPRIKPSAERYR